MDEVQSQLAIRQEQIEPAQPSLIIDFGEDGAGGMTCCFHPTAIGEGITSIEADGDAGADEALVLSVEFESRLDLATDPLCRFGTVCFHRACSAGTVGAV